MTSTATEFTPMGITTVASDLTQAREFYLRLYPHEVTEHEFAGIRFLSIMKDGMAVACVFEKVPGNPIRGTVPVLRARDVKGAVEQLRQSGVRVVLEPSICPCTNTYFSLCEDAEGNQFILKDPGVE